MSTQPIAKCDEHASWLKRLVPALEWLARYERKHLPGDALAGWKGFPPIAAQSLAKGGPLFVVIAGTAVVAGFQLGETRGVNIVGEIPRGLPKFALPALAAADFLLRIDESLYFANAKYMEDFVLCAAAERPQLRHLVLICNAINFIDASALGMLTDLRTRIQEAGIELYLTEVKGPVMDHLVGTEFLQQLGSERVFLTTEEAYEKLASPILPSCRTMKPPIRQYSPRRRGLY